MKLEFYLLVNSRKYKFRLMSINHNSIIYNLTDKVVLYLKNGENRLC